MLLCCLHDAIQAVMGWTDSHLHMFERDGKNWGVTEHDDFGDLELEDESRIAISKLLKAEGDSMIYEYDFGDCWRHEIILEKILPSETRIKPVCLGGERRCPPEDVGGPHGYEEFLEVIFQPDHEEFDHYRNWAGSEFEPEKFDLKKVNETLDRMRWPLRHRR